MISALDEKEFSNICICNTGVGSGTAGAGGEGCLVGGEEHLRTLISGVSAGFELKHCVSESVAVCISSSCESANIELDPLQVVVDIAFEVTSFGITLNGEEGEEVGI